MWWSGLTSSHASPSPVCDSLVTCQLCASTTMWQHRLACSHPRCVPCNSGSSTLKTHIQVTLYGLNRLCLVIHMYEHICICIYMQKSTISEKRSHGFEREQGGAYGKVWKVWREKRGEMLVNCNPNRVVVTHHQHLGNGSLSSRPA